MNEDIATHLAADEHLAELETGEYFADTICTHGHLTVRSEYTECQNCGAGLIPLRIITSRNLRLRVFITEYHPTLSDVAFFRYETGGSFWSGLYNFPTQNPLFVIVGVERSEAVLSAMIRYRIITE